MFKLFYVFFNMISLKYPIIKQHLQVIFERYEIILIRKRKDINEFIYLIRSRPIHAVCSNKQSLMHLFMIFIFKPSFVVLRILMMHKCSDRIFQLFRFCKNFMNIIKRHQLDRKLRYLRVNFTSSFA